MANGIPKRGLARKIARTERAFIPAEIVAALRAAGSRLTPTFLDRRYYGVPKGVWKNILQYTGVDAGQYRSERYDCDDFAKAFAAACGRKLGLNGVGIVVDVSAGHAYNVILVNDGGCCKAVFVEPQNDRIIFAPRPGYSQTSGFIWF